MGHVVRRLSPPGVAARQLGRKPCHWLRCPSWATVNDNSNAMICERLDQFGEVSETVEGGLKFGGISRETSPTRSNWERENFI